MEELKQRLESTEQDEERKKLMKDIDIKDIKSKLAKAKYVRGDVNTIVYILTCGKAACNVDFIQSS